ncbi:nucleoside-diphosphate-sugar epimerase [Shewanella psychrophila]|uniref:Nucleoside-diphosphate-sugar epimerase n=1 Tax=Shewanella psychrophila TaxID=225848 RepID=A0A1S6HTF4_9GAMM|nr:NAD(P)-dependent oxidoreductase [Shewanella psychrophila]AQS38836.1 nucleoside-diphosphate-sugar epimerase [Shewanella psychrophila]
MKALVLGATGFIGQKLVERLLIENLSVTAITRGGKALNKLDERVKFIVFDLISSPVSMIDFSKYDVVFNCAGEIKDESKMEDLHVNSVRSMLEQLKGTGTKWVQLSSVGVYGPKHMAHITENELFQPHGTYEVTKANAEIIVKDYCILNNIAFSIVRPSNVFGCEMPNESLRSLIKMVQSGMFFYIGNPRDYRVNYVHVDNVVESLFLCGQLQSSDREDYIISDNMLLTDFVSLISKFYMKRGRVFTLNKRLVTLVSQLFRNWSRFPLTKSRISALTSNVTYENDKIILQLSYKPCIAIEDGIADFLSKDSGLNLKS